MDLGKCICWLRIFWNSEPKVDIEEGLFTQVLLPNGVFLPQTLQVKLLDIPCRKSKRFVSKKKVNKREGTLPHVNIVVKESRQTLLLKNTLVFQERLFFVLAKGSAERVFFVNCFFKNFFFFFKLQSVFLSKKLVIFLVQIKQIIYQFNCG